MKIAVLGVGHIGSTVGRLWHSAGHAEPADLLTAPFEKLRDHAPDDPAFFFKHLCREVFQAGMSWLVP